MITAAVHRVAIASRGRRQNHRVEERLASSLTNCGVHVAGIRRLEMLTRARADARICADVSLTASIAEVELAASGGQRRPRRAAVSVRTTVPFAPLAHDPGDRAHRAAAPSRRSSGPSGAAHTR
jgi:hypothetical protein